MFVLYVALLVASHLVRWAGSATGVVDHDSSVIVRATDGDRQLDREVRIAYREYDPGGDRARPTIILVHGSPGHKEDFRTLAPLLGYHYRVIAPDLPGFGNSTHDVPYGCHRRSVDGPRQR